MNREQIIRMAREAGVKDWWDSGNDNAAALLECLERFAALVAAAEREHNMQMQNILIDAAVKAEREACAKVCEETTAAWTQHLYNEGCMDCAKAIRARGQE